MTDEEILAVLETKNVPIKVIIAVTAALTKAAILEEQRTLARERKRASRARGHVTSRDVTDCPVTVTGPPPAYTKISPPKDPSKKTASSSRGTRLPSDWQPDLDDEAYASRLGLDWKQIHTDFADYWHARAGPGAVKVDWKATWRRWCRTASERKGNGNGQGRRHGSVLDAFDRLGNKLREAGASDDYIPGTSGPRPLELDPKMRPANPKLISSR